MKTAASSEDADLSYDREREKRRGEYIVWDGRNNKKQKLSKNWAVQRRGERQF